MSYLKLIVALVGAVVMSVASFATDNHVSTDEWIQVAIAGATALGVWAAANVPQFTWAKTFVAVLLAVLNLLVSYITDGISTSEWLNLAVAALTAAGVYAVANRQPDGVQVRSGPSPY